ncbi:MAG: DUF1800 family protein, partial [Bacteroidota bacterium]
DAKNIGCKIKSPIELMAGIQRMLPMTFERDEALLLLQRGLGQLLFYPPNVAGWPGGKTWIDSSTLMLRMRIPQMLNDKDDFNVRPKDDDDQMMGRKNDPDEDPKAKAANSLKRMNRPLIVNIDWSLYTKHYESIPREALLTTVSSNLLQVKSQVKPDLIMQYADNSGRENFIKTATLQIMSTPEYQLC